MNRAGALAYLKARFDGQMTLAGHDLLDDAGGYGDVLDSAFGLYIYLNALDTFVTTTTIPVSNEFCFKGALRAYTYDLILPTIAGTAVDYSIDAPLTSVKSSGPFKNFNALMAKAWEDASICGLDPSVYAHVGAFKVGTDYREPNDLLNTGMG